MRERKYVKFRVDMYSDTKFKIIDMRPERDLIHYVWNRFVILAGKVNLEGELYLSKNIPYTVETLAIEFNREIDQIKLALDTLVELEMIEITEDNVYRVKNFVNHQNIKSKEKVNFKENDEDINDKKVQVNQNLKDEIYHSKNKESVDNRTKENQLKNFRDFESINLEIVNKVKETIDESLRDETQGNDTTIFLETKKNKREHKRKNKDKYHNNIKDIYSDIANQESENNQILCFIDGEEERPLGEGECIVRQWAF